MPDPKIVMTIIHDPSAPGCDGKCGVDWSKPETLVLARERIAARFGGAAVLEYVELKTAKNGDASCRLEETGGSSLPVLLANGRPRIFGAFDVRQLMDAIEVDIEAETP